MSDFNGLLTPVSVIRNSISAVTQILAGRNIPVYQRGLSAFVSYSQDTGEAVSVTLPYLPDDASDDLILAVQGFLDHEVGHLLFTDNNAILSIGHDSSWLEMQNVLEDPFVEKSMQARFPGSKATIHRLHSFFLEKIIDPKYQKAAASGETNPLVYFGTLMSCIARAWHKFPAFEEYMKDKWHHVAPIMAKLPEDVSEMVCRCNSTSDNIKMARVLIDAIMSVPADDEFDETPSEGEPSSTASEKSSGEGSAGGPGGTSATGSGPIIDEEGLDEPDDEDEGDSESEEEPVDDEPADGGDDDTAKVEEDGELDDSPSDDDGAEEPDGDPESESDELTPPWDDEEPETPEETDDSAAGAESFDDERDDVEDMDSGDRMESESTRTSDEVDESAIGSRSGPKGESDDEDGDGEGGPGDGEGEPGESADRSWAPESAESIFEYSPGDIESTLSGEIERMSSSEASKSSYVIYSTDNDVIAPYKVKKGDMAFEAGVPIIEALTKSQVGVMQNSLQRALVSKSKSYWRGSQQSGRINPSSLSRLYVGDTRVFRKKVEHRSRSYDVSLLIDASASMNSPAGSVGGTHLSRFQVAMTAAYAMGDTLSRLGINFEILGFTTKPHTDAWTHECHDQMTKHKIKFGRIDWLYMPIFKDFDEKWGPKCIERIGAAFKDRSFLRENVDGECVQIAAQRLLRQRSEGKLMLVLSDGSPACHTRDYVALTRHLSKSVRSAENAGIKMIGVGINTDEVRNYYTNHIVLNDVTKLPTELVEQVQRVILS